MKFLVTLIAMCFLAACGSPNEAAINAKPSADPDSEITGKADRLSNRYTTIAGELEMDGIVQSNIDFPDWFHGYTIEMHEGEEVQFTTWADKIGIVRLYGPSHRSDSAGVPKFRRALVREVTQDNSGRENNAFVYEPIESGTYMILYGPLYEWESSYEISAKCVAGCQPTDIAFKDLERDLANHIGDTVTVSGFVAPSAVACTRRACMENSCCNLCSAQERLFASNPGDQGYQYNSIGLKQDGADLVCTGDECDRIQACTVKTGEYNITATVVQGSYEPYLDIISMEVLGDPNACHASSDCDAASWCRQTDSSGDHRVCVPYALEGEGCGGFTPPQYVQSCSADLSCVTRPFVADAPGTCRYNLSVMELAANPDTWDGVRVNIDGHINNDASICTLRACGFDEPCCNSCGADQVLADTDGFARHTLGLEQDGNRFSCGGNECTVYDNCTVGEPGAYRVVGVFRKGQYGHKIEVESYTSLGSLNP